MTQQESGITLEDVGARAGCSPATVSRVLNNSAAVSAAVRENVLRVVEEVGYVPRRNQRATVRGTSARKGGGASPAPGPVELVLHRCTPMERLSSDGGDLHFEPPGPVPGAALVSRSYSLSADFYMHIIGGMLDELASVGRRGVLQATDSLKSPKLLAEINDQENRGVVLLGEYSPDLDAFVEACQTPLVLVDIIHACPADVVTVDNMAGIAAAMDHLLQLGHREIGFVGRPFNPGFQERWVSFQWKMAEAGLPVRQEWVYHGSEVVEETARGVERILRQDRLPTAFVCTNDWTAMGVLRGAERAGVSVPGQLSVIGFDDVSAAAMVTPALTTLHVPLRDLGSQAIRQLLIGEMLERSARSRGCSIRLVPELMVRRSTGPVGA